VTRVLVASDNFNRADENPIQSPWLQIHDTGWGAVRITSNVATGSTARSSTIQKPTARYNGAEAFSNDQYSKITGGGYSFNGENNATGVIVRASADVHPDTDYYGLIVKDNSSGPNRAFTLLKMVNGVASTLASGSVGFVNGDTLALEIEGTTLRGYVNDVEVDFGSTITDADLAAGKPGFISTSLVNADNWEGGDIASAAATVPQGTVTISDVTPGTTTADVTYSYDDTDQDSFEYRINEGAAAAIGASPATITGLTEGTAYNSPGIQVRAINAEGAGTWSTAVSFTTASTVATVTVTDPLRNNTGTLLTSETGIKVSVLDATTLESVYEATGLTTNGSGVLAAISNAAITATNSYHVAIKLADGSVGITGPITAT